MRIDDLKHHSWLEVKVDHGFFKMDAQVRLKSLGEMYVFSIVLVLLKILLWKRIKRWYGNWKASRIRYK